LIWFRLLIIHGRIFTYWLRSRLWNSPFPLSHLPRWKQKQHRKLLSWYSCCIGYFIEVEAICELTSSPHGPSERHRPKFCKKLTPYVDYCRLVHSLESPQSTDLKRTYWSILKWLYHLPTFCCFGSRFFWWLPPGRISHVYWVRSPYDHMFLIGFPQLLRNVSHVFAIFSQMCSIPILNGLDDGKICRKALYLIVQTMVSCIFSLKPIHSNTCSVCFPSMSRPPGASPLRLGRHFLRFRYGVGRRTRSLWSQARGGQLGRFGTQATWDLPNVA